MIVAAEIRVDGDRAFVPPPLARIQQRREVILLLDHAARIHSAKHAQVILQGAEAG